MLSLPSMDGLLSARLRYRPLTMGDFDAWMPFHRSQEAIVHFKYALNDTAVCQQVIEKQLQRYATDNSGLRAVELIATGELVGMCGLLSQSVAGTQEIEVGYRFLPAHWGHGYATEAAQATRNLWFNQPEANKLISLITAENTPSQAVAKRNGMTRGIEVPFHGFTVNVWSLSKSDYQAQQEAAT